jgi:hypothetical protein
MSQFEISISTRQVWCQMTWAEFLLAVLALWAITPSFAGLHSALVSFWGSSGFSFCAGRRPD